MSQINQARWAWWFLAALSRSVFFRRLLVALSKAPIFGAPLRRLVSRVFPQKTRVWFRIPTGLGKGLWVNLDPRFEMDYASGKYERQVEQKLSELLRPGAVFYDVGAHIGVLSLVAARLVGTQGIVFAFEADPANAARVEEHSQRNGLIQIRIVPSAVWSTGGRLRFERASTQSSLNQGAVATERTETTVNTVDVDAIALDDFSCRHAPPDLIKIDVEGAEGAVLRGCEQIFATKRPVLICEVHHEDAFGEISRWLLKQNYSFEWLVDSPNFPRHMLAKWHK